MVVTYSSLTRIALDAPILHYDSILSPPLARFGYVYAYSQRTTGTCNHLLEEYAQPECWRPAYFWKKKAKRDLPFTLDLC